jgi:hypothetical protein
VLDSPGGGKRAAVNSLNLTPPAPDPIIVHPGVVVAMLHLLPSIYHVQETQVTYTMGKIEMCMCCIPQVMTLTRRISDVVRAGRGSHFVERRSEGEVMA